MTAPTDQIVDLATRTQQLATAAVRTWADSVQGVVGSLGATPTWPDAHGLVDRYFDVAQQVLDQQRQFAQGIVTAAASAAETVTEQATRAAESVTAHAAEATDRVAATPHRADKS